MISLMHTTEKIVVWDPHNRHAEGLIVQDGANTRRSELMYGLVALPWDPDIATLGIVGGFAKKSFGNGVLFDHNEQRRGCPLLVAAKAGPSRVFWCARLTQEGDHPRGMLRLTSFPNDIATVAGSAVPHDEPIDLGSLGAMDVNMGWTVKGTASLSCPMPGYVSLALQGIATHLRVRWFAASVVEGAE